MSYLGSCMVAVIAGIALLINVTASVASDNPADKRVEEFKTGLENKSHQAGKEVQAAESAHGKAPAVSHGETPKKAVAKKKSSHGVASHAVVASHGAAALDAEEAVKKLLEGNRRYVTEKNSVAHRTAKRRAEIAAGQHPFAVIIGCSDSRVPPEILFDQGLGDLFVIRTAGNVVDDIAIGSIEYSVEHLGTQLIMVLGHERCGAVDATMKGGAVAGKLKSVVDAIQPAIDKARSKGQVSHDCDLLCSSVKSNARMVAEKLRTASPVLAEAFENGLLKVVGAYYDLDSGVVSLTYKPYL